jgi:hypothetical protein
MNFRERMAWWTVRALGATDTITQMIGGVATDGPRLTTAGLLKGYETMPWLRAVADKVGYAVSSTPWLVGYVKDAKTGKGVRRPRIARSNAYRDRIKQWKPLLKEGRMEFIENHRFLDTLSHGNPRFNGQTVLQLTQQYLDLAGETLWMFDVDRLKLPTDIWPLPPTWIFRMPTAQDNNYQVNLPGGVKTLDAQYEALYMYHPRLDNPYGRGTGIAGSLGDELETDYLAAKHMKAWYANRARPDVLITAEGIRKEEIDRLEQSWLAKLGGLRGVNIPYFLNRKVQVDVLTQTFAEMQHSTTRKDERNIILQVWGAPPEIFGIIENSNRSTIDASEYLLNRFVVLPRLEFLRQLLQQQLVERYDERLILEFVNPVMEDHEYYLEVFKAAPWAFRADEWRDLADRDPLEDEEGTGFMVPVNATYKDRLEEEPELDLSGEPPPLFEDDDEDDLPLNPGEDDEDKPKPQPKQVPVY